MAIYLIAGTVVLAAFAAGVVLGIYVAQPQGISTIETEFKYEG